MNKYLKESIKYLLRSYPVIYPYVKEVERMYNICLLYTSDAADE